MRFLNAQFSALLGDGLWLRCAAQANAMARLLSQAVDGIPGVTITRPVQTNAVFATIPPPAIEPLRERFSFYTWDERRGEVRWMCSWDTSDEDVEAFAAAVRDVVA